jgi:hypothetical protein
VCVCVCVCVCVYLCFRIPHTFPEDYTYLLLSKTISILTVVPASLSASSIIVPSNSVFAGMPFIISMFFFDLYGNKADASRSFSGIKIQNVANTMLVSNSIFSATGGLNNISAVAYSSGKSSISILQGINGKVL